MKLFVSRGPEPPPIVSVTLELTPAEARVLRDVTFYQTTIEVGITGYRRDYTGVTSNGATTGASASMLFRKLHHDLNEELGRA